MNKKIKLCTIVVGLSVIYGGFFVSVVTKDQTVSYIENKVLTKFPRLTLNTLISGRFAKQFDTYSTDQFPKRTEFIKLKNSVDYLLGKREFRNIYTTNSGRLLEHFKLNKETLFNNIEGINNLSEKMNLNTTLLLIPTSTEVYKDELPSYAITDNQADIFKQIKEKININLFSALDILTKEKDKDIFFKTDHHWTQEGAKLVFEEMFNKKINEELEIVSNDFYGSYYSKALLNSIKSDTIKVYKNTGNYKIDIDFERKLNSLYDKSKLETKNQYQYFLSGDPGRAVIEGKGKGTLLVLKDSFAHNFVPFLAREFKEIHIIDPRYYNVDINKYSKEYNIEEVLFIHNISTLNSEKIYK